MSTLKAHILGSKGLGTAVVLPRGLAPLLVLTLLSAGCAAPAPSGQGEGIVVTSQPLIDAFERLGQEQALVGIPDWAILEAPLAAERIGRPFVIPPEEVIGLEPRLLVDHPHPLVSGPDRSSLRQRVEQAGIEVQVLPNAPTLAQAKAPLWLAGNATDVDPRPAIEAMEANLSETQTRLQGLERPRAMVLFPAGLVAGAGTDAGRILELAGMTNAAARTGLEGYRPITREAVQQAEVELVIATASMRQTPEHVASRPMFRDTPVEGNASRVLIVDPSRTTRMGPYLDQAVASLAAWAHEEIDGPRFSAWVEQATRPRCASVQAHAPGHPNATATLAGQTHAITDLTVPELPNGHYRLTITAGPEDPRSIDLMLTVEGDTCDA